MVTAGLVALGLLAVGGAAVANGRASRDEPLRVVPAITTTTEAGAADTTTTTTTEAGDGTGVPARFPGRSGDATTNDAGSAGQPAARTATTVRPSATTTKAAVVTTTAPEEEGEPEEYDPPLDRTRQGNRRPNSS